MKINFDNPAFKKGLGIATVLIAGVSAINNALADQKKEQDFEEMKKTVSELQNQMKG